jgi:hypothetical protein
VRVPLIRAVLAGYIPLVLPNQTVVLNFTDQQSTHTNVLRQVLEHFGKNFMGGCPEMTMFSALLQLVPDWFACEPVLNWLTSPVIAETLMSIPRLNELWCTLCADTKPGAEQQTSFSNAETQDTLHIPLTLLTVILCHREMPISKAMEIGMGILRRFFTSMSSAGIDHDKLELKPFEFLQFCNMVENLNVIPVEDTTDFKAHVIRGLILKYGAIKGTSRKMQNADIPFATLPFFINLVNTVIEFKQQIICAKHAIINAKHILEVEKCKKHSIACKEKTLLDSISVLTELCSYTEIKCSCSPYPYWSCRSQYCIKKKPTADKDLAEKKSQLKQVQDELALARASESQRIADATEALHQAEVNSETIAQQNAAIPFAFTACMNVQELTMIPLAHQMATIARIIDPSVEDLQPKLKMMILNLKPEGFHLGMVPHQDKNLESSVFWRMWIKSGLQEAFDTTFEQLRLAHLMTWPSSKAVHGSLVVCEDCGAHVAHMGKHLKLFMDVPLRGFHSAVTNSKEAITPFIALLQLLYNHEISRCNKILARQEIKSPFLDITFDQFVDQVESKIFLPATCKSRQLRYWLSRIYENAPLILDLKSKTRADFSQ